MKFQAFQIGNSQDINTNTNKYANKYQYCYVYGNFNPFNKSCIGLISDNGIFEYRDIYTNQFIRYQIIDIEEQTQILLHFIFISQTEIIFSFENDTNIYKTSYIDNNQSDDIKIFPNNITLNNQSPFIIEHRFECPAIIKCFDIDLTYNRIYCGLETGDVLIGSVKSQYNVTTQNESLLHVQGVHDTEITAIAGSILNAFITSGKDQTAKLWDFDDTKDDHEKIQCLHEFSNISTEGITNIYPFRCNLTDNELLAMSTVEGTIFIYLLNDEKYRLLTILNTHFQSEIMDISSMNDGIILSVSTLNGYIYLYEMINFAPVTYQKISDKPIIFAKYKRENNDYFMMDYNGMNKLYPQTPVTTQKRRISGQCPPNTMETPSTLARIMENSPNDTINPPSITTGTSSTFTVNTRDRNIPQPISNKNPFSSTTISTKDVNAHKMMHDLNSKPFQNNNHKDNDDHAPFQNIKQQKQDRDRNRNIINPMKTKAIIEQMHNPNKENIDPKSKQFASGQSSSISRYYEQKIQEIEDSKFDPNQMEMNVDKEQLQEFEKVAMNKMMNDEQKRRSNDNLYGALPSIPSTQEVIQQKYNKKKEKRKKKANDMIEDRNRFSIAPSIKPFIKRSLEPERRFNINHRDKRRKKNRSNSLRIKSKKTLTLSRNLSPWMKTKFNQQL